MTRQQVRVEGEEPAVRMLEQGGRGRAGEESVGASAAAGGLLDAAGGLMEAGERNLPSSQL